MKMKKWTITFALFVVFFMTVSVVMAHPLYPVSVWMDTSHWETRWIPDQWGGHPASAWINCGYYKTIWVHKPHPEYSSFRDHRHFPPPPWRR
jgi:hypothetical protein